MREKNRAFLTFLYVLLYLQVRYILVISLKWTVTSFGGWSNKVDWTLEINDYASLIIFCYFFQVYIQCLYFLWLYSSLHSIHSLIIFCYFIQVYIQYLVDMVGEVGFKWPFRNSFFLNHKRRFHGHFAWERNIAHGHENVIHDRIKTPPLFRAWLSWPYAGGKSCSNHSIAPTRQSLCEEDYFSPDPAVGSCGRRN